MRSCRLVQMFSCDREEVSQSDTRKHDRLFNALSDRFKSDRTLLQYSHYSMFLPVRLSMQINTVTDVGSRTSCVSHDVVQGSLVHRWTYFGIVDR